MLDELRRKCAIEAAKRGNCTEDELFERYTPFLPNGIETRPSTRSPTENALLSILPLDPKI